MTLVVYKFRLPYNRHLVLVAGTIEVSRILQVPWQLLLLLYINGHYSGREYVSCFSLPATPTRREEIERVIEEEIRVTGIRRTQAILSLFKRWQQLETFF